MAGQALEHRVRVSRKGAVYLPRELMRLLGIGEGSELLVRVEGGRLVMTPLRDPLELALRGPKYARVRAEDVERWSEEWQEELAGG